jgi:hypothetical protein
MRPWESAYLYSDLRWGGGVMRETVWKLGAFANATLVVLKHHHSVTAG